MYEPVGPAHGQTELGFLVTQGVPTLMYSTYINVATEFSDVSTLM